MFLYTRAILLLSFIIGLQGRLKSSPPHCTVVSKETDYPSRYTLTYPVAYIPPGQREAYQLMYCVNPAGVKKEVSTVCDWAAPPQVQFTLGDDYLHVVRQDPTGHFAGNAVINTYQYCNHTIPPHLENEINIPDVKSV